VEAEVRSTAPPRRKHSPEFKAEVIQACRQPGVSIKAVARERGLNPSLVRYWLTGRVYGKGAGQTAAAPAQQAATPSAPGFMAVRVDDRQATASTAIGLEIRRGGTAVSVQWPAQEAAACGAWLKEWLR
jgi:transposase-like protein